MLPLAQDLSSTSFAFGMSKGESPLLASASLSLAKAALHAAIGDPEFGRHGDVPTDAILPALRSSFVDGLQGPTLNFDSNVYKELEAGRTREDFAEMAWRSFVATYACLAKIHNVTAPIPLLSYTLNETRQREIAMEFGLAAQRSDEVAGGSDLEAAWQCTYRNHQDAQAAIVLMSIIRRVIAQNDRRPLPSTVESQLGAIYSRLYFLATDTERDLLALGLLIGGERLEQARHIGAQRWLPGGAVMNLVTRGRRHPGGYSSRREDELRGAILAAASGADHEQQ